MTRKEINTIKATGSKGVYSLFLAFLLFLSLSVKSFSASYNAIHWSTKLEKASLKTNKIVSFSQSVDENEELAEFDIDDDVDDFFHSVPGTLKNAIAYNDIKKTPQDVLVSVTVAKNPLYILYCKWKFHLI